MRRSIRAKIRTGKKSRKSSKTGRRELSEEEKKIWWGANIAISPEQEKGKRAELLAEESLKRLQQKKQEFYLVGMIVSVTPTEHLDPEDRRAIDVKIGFLSETIFAEVKAHQWTEQEARMWLKRNRCFIGIPPGTRNEAAVGLVKVALTWFLRDREKMRSAKPQLIGAYH